MPIGTDLLVAAEALRAGQLVAIPTETVYGLAANALDEQAVLHIFEAKNRPSFDPLIVHTWSVAQIPAFAQLPEQALRLFEAFSPGPLTVLLPKLDVVPDMVTSGLPRVAVRIPRHPLTLDLLKMLPFPLAAPSANPFGYISPTTAAHVDAQLGQQVGYILDGGPCGVGVESTIVGFEDDAVVVYRLGGLAPEELERVTGPVAVRPNQSSNPAAPGMLLSHYAPRKPMYIGQIGALLMQYGQEGRKLGVLSFTEDFGRTPGVVSSVVLSPDGSVAAAARRLFAAMRELDASAADVIVAEWVPDEGIGRAVNDRLSRAASGWR